MQPKQDFFVWLVCFPTEKPSKKNFLDIKSDIHRFFIFLPLKRFHVVWRIFVPCIPPGSSPSHLYFTAAHTQAQKAWDKKNEDMGSRKDGISHSLSCVKVPAWCWNKPAPSFMVFYHRYFITWRPVVSKKGRSIWKGNALGAHLQDEKDPDGYAMSSEVPSALLCKAAWCWVAGEGSGGRWGGCFPAEPLGDLSSYQAIWGCKCPQIRGSSS